jgi:chromate transporter
MERELVQERQWLSKEEMRDGIAACQSLPGPLAIQVGIFISYLRSGLWAEWAGGWVFILPNLLIVATLGALYVHYSGLRILTIFCGVSPAVIALILHSCYRLAKLGMEDWLQWAIAAACFIPSESFMRQLFLFVVAVMLAFGGDAYSEIPDQSCNLLTQVQTIPLDGVEGRIDHFGFGRRG